VEACESGSRRASAGGKPRLLTRGTFGELSWSPTSDRIAVLQWASHSRVALVSVDVASGEAVELGRGAVAGWSFSPDGSRIVFDRAKPNPTAFSVHDLQVDLFVADAEDGGTKRITESGDNGYPVWGPESIAFAKLVPHDGWGRDEIWRIAPDGKGAETITGRTPERLLGKGYEGLVPIDWSEDGSALLAALMDEGGTPLTPFAVDPETGRLRELAGGPLRTAALSRDGRFVLVESETTDGLADWSVEIVPFAGGEPRIVARGAIGPSWNR
jgi:Tol biopolymer transport system component